MSIPLPSAMPLLPPIYLPGQEPLPAGTTDWERQEMQTALKYQRYMGMVMESCPLKVTIAGVGGLALGGFFSLMSATFAYEDPLSRASNQLTTTRAQTMFVFKEMGRNMWSSGKGFAKVGMVYSGVECCIEGYRAKNDIYNGVSAGFLTGAILARNAGPTAMLGGGVAFAAFSGAIDWWLRSAPADEI
ncbi:mitochondrial import inner membrane translocase subunit TIM22 [Cryptococcus tetragattii IND107]|uniref:Mitochondrial import inner membrane translocase subunit TIM22 n=4 Tax=Cryptococcus gattii species complex TaxID=1884637 RepID=A0A0D0TND7_CRYGA|nr:mitochondrial import inner membrane translocase subunit TIM22 [Cryptococcus bacillisporus CA1280]KIR69400.1 mitochondrial import inner membrane translocase subunit TIM22 [Cryptococcus bacillisporus CA1873]KIR87105.1 mitochondrial import inner membrane translocase subunit TIM22 [Cryptococcus tetragattii IND107]|eukprot:KIR69400.1 mitochondrial import inner membrane translocase subunit TIM22 [Cryptococcus gattii CA1873]